MEISPRGDFATANSGKFHRVTFSSPGNCAANKKDRVIEKEYSKFKQIMDVKREAKPKKGKNPSEKATG